MKIVIANRILSYYEGHTLVHYHAESIGINAVALIDVKEFSWME